MKKLYDIALRAMKDKSTEKSYCGNCFSWKIQKELEKTNINCDYYKGTRCSNPLFYLEDLGVIKILQGVANRSSGVDCNNLKIKVLHPLKVIKYENSKTL